MDSRTQMRSGGHILIDQLALHGADTVFGVPGESFLAALDGMHQNQRVRFVNARQEGGATMMADAYGKLTGQPGIAFATRGPGATNASSGVHVAFQDSTPMILLLGQVGRDMMEREAFQEMDYRQMFGPMTKWVAQIDDARRIPEFISRAFYTATSGRPGPVVLALLSYRTHTGTSSTGMWNRTHAVSSSQSNPNPSHRSSGRSRPAAAAVIPFSPAWVSR
jgi:acetolactate synthase-1/2/3 large subunit